MLQTLKRPQLSKNIRKRVKQLQELNEDWYKGGVWAIEKNGKIKTLGQRKEPEPLYIPVARERICRNHRDTAIASVKSAGLPGSNERIQALREAYSNDSEDSPFTCDMGEVLAPYFYNLITREGSNDQTFQRRAEYIETLTNGSKRT